MTNEQKTVERMEQIYLIILIGIMPLVITPGYSEQYFVGKIIVAGVATFIMIVLKGRELLNGYGTLEMKLVFTLAIITIASTIMSIDVPVSVQGSTTAPEGLVTLLLCYAIFVVTRTFKTIHLKTLIIALWLATIVAVIALLEYGGFIDLIMTYLDGYVVDKSDLSTIGNRNFIGTFSVLLIPTVLGLIIYFKSRQLGIVLALLVGLMVVSQTRSTYIAFGIILLLFLKWTMDNRKHFFRTIIIIGVMVCVVILGVYIMTFILRDYRVADRLLSLMREVLDIFSGLSGDMGSHRIAIWYDLLPEVLRHFWLGSGPDTIEALNRSIGNLGISQLYYQKAHNHWLQMAVTQGVPYILVYFTFIYVCLKELYKKTNTNFWSRVLIITIAAYEVQGLFSISVPGNSFIYWAVLGIGTSKMVIGQNVGGQMETDD